MYQQNHQGKYCQHYLNSARLQKRDGGIEIVQIILGGPLWKDKKIEAGDEIIKVGDIIFIWQH